MAKARAIVKRRKAVRNIKKITKTMQMIATAKFQKSLKRAVGTKPYTLKVRELVRAAKLPLLEDVDFVGSYRGKQIGDGKKSLTLRMSFRDASRTLRREEVDPQVAEVVRRAGEQLGAIVRA